MVKMGKSLKTSIYRLENYKLSSEYDDDNYNEEEKGLFLVLK
jgi:hypothetical protein